MSYNISDLVRTKDEHILLEAELLVLEKAFFTNDKNASENALSKVRTKTADYIESKLAEKISFEDAVKQMKDDLEKCLTLELTIACEPSRHLIDNISAWLKTNTNMPIVLDILYDPSLIAGAKIAFAGKYLDASFTKRIEQILKEQS